MDLADYVKRLFESDYFVKSVSEKSLVRRGATVTVISILSFLFAAHL
jgi:hypothetical protein